MRIEWMGAMALIALAACQQENLETVANVSDNAVMVEAEIQHASRQRSRTTTTTQNGQVVFAEGDEMGFYMPEADMSVKWTYSKEAWSTTGTYEWADKVNAYKFCAYYPFAQTAPRTEIPMPDLSKQTGSWDDVSKFDFLVARCEASYATKNGVVSFTDDEAFHHVYTLVSITLQSSKESEDIELTEIKLSGANLATTHTYHFGASSTEDGTTLVDTGTHNEITFSETAARAGAHSYNKVFVVNPIKAGEPVTLSVKYTRDGTNYTASTKALGKELSQGNLYNLTVKLKKEKLEVVGNTVTEWIVNDLPSADLEEIPVPAEEAGEQA